MTGDNAGRNNSIKEPKPIIALSISMFLIVRNILLYISRINCKKLNVYSFLNKMFSVFSERYANMGDKSMRIIYFINLPTTYHIKILIRNVIPHSIPEISDSLKVERIESLDVEKNKFNNCFEIS